MSGGAARACVSETQAHSVDRLAAGVLLPSFHGTRVPEWVRRWLDRGLGGITLFADNVGEGGLASLTAELRAESPELLLAIDEEGGDVTRLEARTGSSSAGNLALGAVDDLELTAAVAGEIAAAVARAGVTLNLAPVADVNTNPRNPVIGVRSFGADPELVARHVAAFVTGTQRHRVAACAKHFPGHGDVEVDSHRALPVVAGELDAALRPFRAALEAGVRAVMVGHLLVPALDSVPATVSRRLVTGILREELGFEGLVVSDALEMRGLSATMPVPDAAVEALCAGVDALCLGHDLGEEAVEAVHAAVVAAVAAGRLPAARLGEAAERVRAAATWTAAADHEDTPGRHGAGLNAARRALRVHGAPRLDAPPLVVELVPEANIASGEAQHGLADVWPGAKLLRQRGKFGHAAARARDAAAPVVVVVRDAARHAWQREAVLAITVARPDAVVVETGVPGWRPPTGVALVETHGCSRASLQAVLERLREPADAPAAR